MRNLAREVWPQYFKTLMSEAEIVEDMYRSVRRSPASTYFILMSDPDRLHARIGKALVVYYGLDREDYPFEEGDDAATMSRRVVDLLWERVQRVIE